VTVAKDVLETAKEVKEIKDETKNSKMTIVATCAVVNVLFPMMSESPGKMKM